MSSIQISIQISQNQRNQCKRQFIRTMISNWNPEAGSSPITNSFLAMNIEGLPFIISAIQHQNCTSLTQNDFTLKEGFKIKIRKKAPTPFHLYLRHSCDTTIDDDVSVNDRKTKSEDQVDSTNFWIVLKKGIKGVKENG